MLSFSVYLEQRNIDNKRFIDKPTKDHYLTCWLQAAFSTLKPSVTYLPEVAKSLEAAARKEFNRYLSRHWKFNEIDKNIDEIENLLFLLYFQLVYYARVKSTKTPLQPTLSYQYNRRHTGVSISAYVVTGSQGNGSIFGEKVWQAHDMLQHKKIGNNIAIVLKDIRDKLETSQLTSELKKLVMKRCQEKQFHAEDYWFSVYADEMINYLKDQVKNKLLVLPKEPLDDTMWLSQLFTFPRIEFVMTSSSCADCQPFFSNFRKRLNDEKLFLPIVVYANSPFNKQEVTTSPVILIKFNTEYFFTRFTAKMPYYLDRKEAISQALLVHGIFTREERAFTRLENIINVAMPKVINSPMRLQEAFIGDIILMMCDVGQNINRTTYYWFANFLGRYETAVKKNSFTQLEWNNNNPHDEDYDAAVKRLFGWPKGAEGEPQEQIEYTMQNTIESYFECTYSDEKQWLTPYELGMTFKEYYQTYICELEIQKNTLPFTIIFRGKKRLADQEKMNLYYFESVLSAFLTQQQGSKTSYKDNQLKVSYFSISPQAFSEVVIVIDSLFQQYCLPVEENSHRAVMYI